MKQKKKYPKPTAYDRGQHQLICNAVGCSSDPNAIGCTAYEAVCVLLMKLQRAHAVLKSMKQRKLVKYLETHHDAEDFSIIKLYGTEKL